MHALRHLLDVRYWHETVIAVQPPHVRCRSRSGKHVLGESISPFDPERTYGDGADLQRQLSFPQSGTREANDLGPGDVRLGAISPEGEW